MISKQWKAMDSNNVSSVINWPIITNAKGVCGFLGLTEYYRKVIASYGRTAKLLTEITKKYNFNWNFEAEKGFKQMKLAVITVLALPNFDIMFEIHSDALGKGVGEMLMQYKLLIAYINKAFLGSIKLCKSAYDEELMMFVLVIQHWQHCLLRRKFIVYSDKKSIRHLVQQRITKTNKQEWKAKLLGFDFEVFYKVRLENKETGTLSRKHEGV